MALAVVNKNFVLNATGTHNESSNLIDGTIIIKNLENSLESFGFANEIRDAVGNVSFQCKYPGNISDLGWHNAQLESVFAFSNGRIMSFDPGIGKLLGLLSLDNLQRRLRLDFRDLLQKGFVFDNATGYLDYDNQAFHFKKVLIDGPNADIRLQGQIARSSHDLDLRVGVRPKASAGLPLAAAVAGGPAIGAGFWVLDKLISANKVKAEVDLRYQITGTLDKPVFKEYIAPSLEQ